jgi:hypothetical protein
MVTWPKRERMKMGQFLSFRSYAVILSYRQTSIVLQSTSRSQRDDCACFLFPQPVLGTVDIVPALCCKCRVNRF